MAFDMATAVMGIASVMAGIIAVSLTLSAHRRMSNPELLGYVKYLQGVMISLTLFSSWHAAKDIFGLKEIYGPIIEMPEYGLVILTCILLLLGARSVLRMSRVYGFRERGREKPGKGKEGDG